jgi:hypothetical protein
MADNVLSKRKHETNTNSDEDAKTKRLKGTWIATNSMTSDKVGNKGRAEVYGKMIADLEAELDGI